MQDMNTALPIRLAEIDDFERVIDIVHRATRTMEEYGIFQWDKVYPSEAILETDIKNRHMHVIESAGIVNGLIVLNEEEPPEYRAVSWGYYGKVLVVHRLTIHPEHQGKKLASQLIDFAEQEAKLNMYDTIRLDAFACNTAAIALYEGRKYRKVGTVRFRKGLFFCYEKLIASLR